MIYGHRVFVILIYVLKINHRGKPWSLETNNHYAYHKYLIYRGKPCSFRLVPSGPPEPPTGCVTNNFTYSSFTVNMLMMLMKTGWFFTGTGCPKKKCTNRMLLEPWCTGSTTGGWHHLSWKVFFWSFLAETKPDQAFASHVHGKT